MAARVIRAEDKRARNKIQTGSDQRNETSLPSVTSWPDEKRETLPSVSKLPLPSRNYESPALCRPDDTRILESRPGIRRKEIAEHDLSGVKIREVLYR